MEERLPEGDDVTGFDKDAFVHFDLDLANSEWLFPGDVVDSKQYADA